MKILAIETATEMCSVALWSDADIFEIAQRAPNRHSELLLPMVEAVLREGGTTVDLCDAIAIGAGPGSFTALRIGLGVAQGLALASRRPLVPVSSLAALACRFRSAHVAAAIDARMNEAYWAAFRVEAGGACTAKGEARVGRLSAIELDANLTWLAIGSGWDRYPEARSALQKRFAMEYIPNVCPRAADVARLACAAVAAGSLSDAAGARLEYVRDEIAEVPAPVNKQP